MTEMFQFVCYVITSDQVIIYQIQSTNYTLYTLKLSIIITVYANNCDISAILISEKENFRKREFYFSSDTYMYTK